MRRFLLFAGHSYYPEGGWNDLVDAFDTREEAAHAARMLWQDRGLDWAQIVDTAAQEPTTAEGITFDPGRETESETPPDATSPGAKFHGRFTSRDGEYGLPAD